MPDRGDGGDRGGRRPPGRGSGGPPRGNRPHRPPGQVPTPPRRAGGINVRRLGGDDFELVHPGCVREMELDYVEGLEIREAGDPEGARDALRYALQGCGDNLWVHVALGMIALEDFKDPKLGRAHFGYAFELAQKAFPPDFQGRLPRNRVVNQPYFDAIEGLARCYEAVGQHPEAAPLRELVKRLDRGRPTGGGKGPRT